MRPLRVAAHNVRGAVDVTVHLRPFSALIGPNNAGKSTLLDAVRLFYDALAWDDRRDRPWNAATDDPSWVEIAYELTESEADALVVLGDEERDEGTTGTSILRGDVLHVRRYLTGHGGYAAGEYYLLPPGGGELTPTGWDEAAGKLGQCVYVPTLTQVRDQTSLSGPSPLRDILLLAFSEPKIDFYLMAVTSALRHREFAGRPAGHRENVSHMPAERFLHSVSPSARPSEAALRATIEELAPIQRPPCSPGERAAAHLIAHRLRMLGCSAQVEEEPAFGSYARPVGALAGLSVAAGLAGARSRLLGVVGGAVAAAGLVDEISYGRQLARRVVSTRLTACNVVAELGDPRARRTLVVMAHHDAAPSGAIFDQTLERWFVGRYPQVVDRIKENPPLWWLVLAGPLLAGLGSATGHKGLRRTGVAVSALTAAAMADIGSRKAVPGANDNLSGVAVLISLAEALRARPVQGLRVILLSAGAEEALQEGIRGFARRHFPGLPRESTWFYNLDTVGSGNLVMLDAEGPVRMEPYDAAFGDLIARCAVEQDVNVMRGLRSRNSTDGVVPNRHGYPTACLVSVDDQKLLPHYHLPADLPEHVDYSCVADAAQLTEAVTRALATH